VDDDGDDDGDDVHGNGNHFSACIKITKHKKKEYKKYTYH